MTAVDRHELPIVIVGAGVTGLSCAFRLHRAGQKVVVFEASDRAGGNIQTVKHDGFLYDLGPDSFLKTKPAAAQLCRDLGLSDDLVAPRSGAHLVHVAHRGRLHPMPEGLSLGVPKRAGPILRTPLLSMRAKLRALMEPFVARRRDDNEETIFAFLARRMGPEMAERLAAPLLSGVFAGDATKLSIDAAFPQLVELEKRYGSLFSGMNGGRSLLSVLFAGAPPPSSPFLSLSGGLGELIDALVKSVPGEALRLSTPVQQLCAPSAPGEPALVRALGDEVRAQHVVIAGPAWSARDLLVPLDAKFDELLGGVNAFSTATVFFGFEESPDCPELLGSGFIVPPGEGEILAATFISSKWEGRAPEGSALVRAFVGGARKDITQLSDDELRALAERELSRLLGDLGSPLFSRVHRYSKGTPQPEIGYGARLERIESRVKHHPWLSLIGSGHAGAGIPDCVRQADELAARWGTGKEPPSLVLTQKNGVLAS